MQTASIAHYIPAWAAPYLIRLGSWLQEIGRECYHQCHGEQQATIKAKLAKVYDETH